MNIAPPRRMMIDGQQALVVETTPPIPQRLDALLASMHSITVREDIRPAGAARQCEQDRTHRFGILREGRHVGLDRELRDLRVEQCRDCGAVCVRDITYDRLTGLPVGRRGPLRRDHILGWYSGARRNRREYI
jgi:hypothetical protein